MIDIHSHILQGVDDGSPDIKTSLEMLKKSAEQGVTDVFLTPHFRGKRKKDKQFILQEFEELRLAKERENIRINIYVGEEVHYEEQIFSDEVHANILTLNNGKNLLLEFSERQEIFLSDVIYEVSAFGYNPIIAHVERYNYMTVSDLEYAKEHGAKIQINADAVTGKAGRKYKKRVFKFLKAGLVDFVASDYHSDRQNDMKKAFEIIRKKFGEDWAEKLFYKNAKELLDEKV